MKSFLVSQVAKLKQLLPAFLQGASAGLTFWYGSIAFVFFRSDEEGYSVEVEDNQEQLFAAEERALTDLLVALDAWLDVTSDFNHHDEDTCSF